MTVFKKQNVFGWLVCAGAVLALVALIIYIANSTSGFLAGSGVNAIVVLFPIIAILGSVLLFLFSDRLSNRVVGFLTFVLGLLMAVACVQFVVARIDAIGELLNPVPHGDAELSAIKTAVTGIVFYAVSMLLYVAATIGGRLVRKEK